LKSFTDVLCGFMMNGQSVIEIVVYRRWKLKRVSATGGEED
jgi:hypothetical protein